MSWLNPGRWLLLGGLLAALILGYGAWSRHQQGIGEARATIRYNAAIDKQKITAALLLADQTEKADAATHALGAFKLQREKDDVKNQSTIADLAGRLRAAAGATGQLRDPNAAAGCGGSGGGPPTADPGRADTGATDGAEADRFLSADLTELLLSQAQAADDINVAYASCRLDAFNLREVLK